uniref:Uncharacterized protein n=1 Tax=Sphaerodactylus townsendi TaxID=933632 RepID=A0ACB8EVM0_9SAUR
MLFLVLSCLILDPEVLCYFSEERNHVSIHWFGLIGTMDGFLKKPFSKMSCQPTVAQPGPKKETSWGMQISVLIKNHEPVLL